MPTISHRMGARRLRRLQNDNFVDSVIAMAPPCDAERHADAIASELPFFCSGTKFSLATWLSETQDDGRSLTPPRTRPQQRHTLSGRCPTPGEVRLMRLTGAERALLREFAGSSEAEATEVRIRAYLHAVADAVNPCDGDASFVVVSKEEIQCDGSSDGWELVSQPSPDGERQAASASQPRQDRRPLIRRVSSKRRPASGVDTARGSRCRSSQRLSPCLMAPTSNPKLRAMHRAVVNFYSPLRCLAKSTVAIRSTVPEERCVTAEVALGNGAEPTLAARLRTAASISLGATLTEAAMASRRRLQL